MKNLLLTAFLMFATNAAFAQTGSADRTTSTKDSTIVTDTAAMANIYVVRSTGHAGSAINLRLLVDDVVFCKIRNNRYAQFYVPPGTHLFNATTWDKPGSPEKFALKLPVEAGKTYYISLRIKQKFMGIEILAEEITYNTAGPLLQKYKRDACD